MHLTCRSGLRVLASTALLLALTVGSAHAQQSVSYPFQLEGTLQVGTCDSAGAPDLRSIDQITMYAKGQSTPTCSSPVGLLDPTCTARALLEGAVAVLITPGDTAPYAVPLQRLMFTEPALPALPELIGPLTYQMTFDSTGSGPRIYFQGSSRYVAYGLPAFRVLAPVATDPADEPSNEANGQVETLDIHNLNMASLRFTLSFKPTRQDGFGALDLGYGSYRTISTSTNASPIEVTTTTPHGFHNGDIVEVAGHATNTAANGVWTVVYVTATKFQLVGSTGTGVGSGGTVRSRRGASERIANVRLTATGTDGGTHNITHHFNSNVRVPDLGQDPASIGGYLETTARVLGDTQVIRGELPITPNAGPFAVTSYAVSAIITFDDNTNISFPLPSLQLADFAPCGTVNLAPYEVIKPRTTLAGSILLRPATGYTTSPYVTDYAPVIRWMSGPETPTQLYQQTSASGATIYNTVNPDGLATTPASSQTPYTFSWTGLTPGNYRVESRNHSSGAQSYQAGHLWLSFPGRPAYTYFTSESPDSSAHTARFAFPTLGWTTASTAAADFATSGQFSIAEDAPMTLDIAADMAYLEGNLTLTGCLTNDSLSSGAAELLGQVSGLTGGFARGLFKLASTNYLVAAVGGGWKESRYRLKIDESDYDGMILIQPANPSSYTLVGTQTVAGANRSYVVSSVSIAFDTGGQLVRKPRLEIGQDIGTGSTLLEDFYDPANSSSLLGKYYSVSNELDATPLVDPLVSVYGLASSRPTTIRPSVEVLISTNPEKWGREYRPTLQLLLTSSADDGCVNTCISYNLDGTSVVYTDDGQGPVVSGTTPSQNVPANTTTFTITGTLTDEVPIDEVLINGLPCSSYLACTLTPTSAGPVFTTTFSVTVPLVEGSNSFAITGVGLCDNVTTRAVQVVITVPPDLCADPGFDMCMEGNPGSVFYLDVVRTSDDAVCQLRCEIAAPGAALTCDSTPVCPN